MDATGGNQEPQQHFRPNITDIPGRVKALRAEQPDICWRPSPGWRHICIKDLAHAGRCGWEEPTDA